VIFSQKEVAGEHILAITLMNMNHPKQIMLIGEFRKSASMHHICIDI